MNTTIARRHCRSALIALSGLVTLTTAHAQKSQPAPLTDVSVDTIAASQNDEKVEAVVIETQTQPQESVYEAPDLNYWEPASEAQSCSCCQSTCCTKKKKETATEKMKGAYKGVFYANDFRYLNDKCYDGPEFFGDSLKGLCDGKLDIGGEIRVRYHSERNHRGRVAGLNAGPGNASSGLGLTTNDDEFFLTRYRMFANYRVNEIFRVYGEYLYADSGGETFSNRPIEENRGEIQNLFLDTKLTDSLTVRLGRQELLFGAQRLISPLDWANTRRSFQGGLVNYAGENWNVNGFWVNPLNRNAANESKIDDANEDVNLYGLYATRKGTRWGDLEAYYIGLDNNTASDFSYHTLGNRLSGKTDGGLLYDFEGGIQFGDNSPGFGSHSAHFTTAGLGRQLTVGDWKPTLWFWYDYASGGDDFPGARGDDGFDHLFPLAHKYNGFIDLFGRRNLHDVNAQFITPVLGPKVKLLVWYHYLFLDEKTTPYDVTMAPYNRAAPAGDRELGHEIDVLVTAAINPRQSVLVGYSYFSAGDYYDTTAGVPNNDAQFFYSQYQLRF